jgi:CARDB
MEPLEPRIFLAATQTLLPPGVTTGPLALEHGQQPLSLEFSVNNASPGQLTQFSTSAGPNNTAADYTTIQLTDSNGNTLASLDTGSPNQTLSYALQSGQVYIVTIVALTNSSGTAQLSYSINTGPQAMADTVAINPATGTATLTADAAPDAFVGSGDVRYFPVSFLNGGSSGTVAITAAAPDTSVDATLFENIGGSYTQIATGTGLPSLAVTPPAGQNLTDGTYLLAVSPLNYTAPPEAFTITASASSLLVPAIINPASVTSTLLEDFTPPGVTFGAPYGTVEGSESAGGSSALYAVTAAATGTVTVNYGGDQSLAIYGESGTTLDQVASQTSVNFSASTSMSVTAGSTYYLLVTPSSGFNGGITISQTYTPIAVAVGSAAGEQTGLGTFSPIYRLTPAAGANFLVIQLAPDPGSTLTLQLQITGPNQTPASYTAVGPGQPVTVVLPIGSEAGPYDVFSTSTSGSGTATLHYQAITAPTQVGIDQFPTQTLGVNSGGFTTSAVAATPGTLVGAQFYEFGQQGVTTASALTATTSGGATAVLLHYVQEGNVLQLADLAAPSQILGSPTPASASVVLANATLQAVVALPVGFSIGGTVQLSVAGPVPTPAGVAMIPTSSTVFRNGQFVTEYFDDLMIKDAQLTSDTQVQYYQTELPYNLTDAADEVTFAPVASATLTATVSVYSYSGGTSTLVASGTNAPGQALSPLLFPVTPTETVRILVQPVTGAAISDGRYNLGLEVDTTNPNPFLVTETSFYPYSSSQTSGDNYLPNGLPIPPIQFGSFDDGDFTSNVGYNSNGTGSIQMFSFAPTAGQPFEVYTTDTDPTINTDINLYYFSGGVYKQLGTGPSLDYYPATQTPVNSKLIVNNTDFTAAQSGGANVFYVVVMNQQGTEGRYQIFATPVPTPATEGPGNGTSSNDLIPYSTAVSSSSYAQTLGTIETLVTTNGEELQLTVPYDIVNSATATLNIGDGNALFGYSGEAISVKLYEEGFLIDTLSGTINSSNTLALTIPANMLYTGPGELYSVQVTSTSNGAFPADGLDVSLEYQPSTASPSPPTFMDTTQTPPESVPDGYDSAFSRADPSPTGAFSSTFSASGSGTLEQQIFSVPETGLTTLSVTVPSNATNVVVALYQCGSSAVGETLGSIAYGVLFDYANFGTNGVYTFNDNLPAGTYYIEVTGTLPSGTHSITISGQLPEFDAQQVTPEPSTGTTSITEAVLDSTGYFTGEEGVNEINGPFPNGEFQTQYYEATVPANGSGSPVSVEVIDDEDGASKEPSPDGEGQITATIWRDDNGTFTQVGATTLLVNDAANPAVAQGTLTATDIPAPGTVYFFGIDFNGYSGNAHVLIDTPTFISATPNLKVNQVQLSAANGQTLVVTTISDNSFAPSPSAPAQLSFTNITTPDVFDLVPLAPFASYQISQLWTPDKPSDVVTLTEDPSDTVPDLIKTGSPFPVALSTVDASLPAITIALSDTSMTGEGSASPSTGGGTWGRYISGVSGQSTNLLVSATQSSGNLYQTTVDGLYYTSGGSLYGNQTYSTKTSNTSESESLPIDFGSLMPTASTNPNQIQFQVLDRYGLRSPLYTQTIDVVPTPMFFTGTYPPPTGATGDNGTITFNAATHQFSFAFEDDLVNESDTVNSLLGTTIPVLGDKQNAFLVRLYGSGTTGLKPPSGGGTINLPISGEVSLEIVNNNVFDETYTGSANLGNGVTFHSNLVLNGRTLEPGVATVSLDLSNLNVFNYETPLIPVFAYGIPGIAAIEAGFKFGVSAGLSAGATLGLNPAFLANPTSSNFDLGIASPSYIEPSVTGSASVVGEVTVLGFDLADITGTIGLTLNFIIGLDNSNPAAVFTPSSLGGNLGVAISADIDIGLSASIFLIGNIFSFSDSIPLGLLVDDVNHGIFLTDPPTTSGGLNNFIPPGSGAMASPLQGVTTLDEALTDPAALISQAMSEGMGTEVETMRSGTSLVGAYPIDPTPQIVINNTSAADTALSVQTVNVGTTNNPLANLEVSTRTGGTWSTPTVLSEANDVSKPTLALTNDSPGNSAAVVVYDADNVAGSPAGQTVNQRLDSEDIRYRYFNGTTWGPEQSVTSDNLDEEDPSVAFNSSGTGVLAYVQNTDSAPVSSGGSFDNASDDIYASIWIPSTHTWSTPLAITSMDGVADTNPATFVDSSGNRYVVWVRGSGAGNELAYSMYTGSGWTAPKALPVLGLPAGQFNSVAIGSDAAGRVDVLFTYGVTNSDGTFTSTLYDRPTTIAGFTSPATVVQVSTGANYSDLQVTNSASGMLVAYWEQSDGVNNQIFSSTLSYNGSTDMPWSTPAQLTDDPNLAMEPSLAVDGNGQLQVLYDNDLPYNGISNGNPTDPSVGAPLAPGVASSSVQALPQFSFTSGLSFTNYTTAAPVGSTVTGTAVITNRGFASAPVTISAYDGLPSSGSLVGSQTITLSPGSTFNVSELFTVAAGDGTYSIQLTTPGAQAFDTTENLSTATLNGLADLSAVSLTPSAPAPFPGDSITLTANIENLSTIPIGAFTVTLYSGDPLAPQFPVSVLATQQVTGMSALQDLMLNFPITIPTGAGDDVYTVVADSGALITESTKGNNEARYEVDFQADPAIYPTTGVGPAVTATLLNTTGPGNVHVTVDVANLGSAAITNVPIDLFSGLEGGALTSVGQQVITSLPADMTKVLIFDVTGVAGDNVYQASVDPSVEYEDSNLSDNVGTTDLNVQGLADLTVTQNGSFPSMFAAGSPLTLEAFISNSGIANAQNVPVTVLLTNTSTGTDVTVGTAVANVGAFGGVDVAIPLTTTGLVNGPYTLTIELDPGQNIPQSSRAGNTLVITGLTIASPVTISAPVVYLSYGSGDCDVFYNSTGTGTPAEQILLSTAGTLEVTEAGGSQTLTVDFSSGDPLPGGGLIYSPPAGGANTLNIIGSPYSDAVSVTDSIVTLTNFLGSGAIAYTNVSSITFAGGVGNDSLTQQAQPGGGATLTFLNPTAADTLDVAAGTFTFAAPPNGAGVVSTTLGNLEIAAGASVVLAPSSGRILLVLDSLSLAGNLDLTDNTLEINYGSPTADPITAIRAALISGYNGGAWTGTGIFSSTAAGDPTAYTLGYADGDNPVDAANTGVPAGEIKIMYTVAGDANLSASVDLSDLVIVASDFGKSGADWAEGDVNYDGNVDLSDLVIVASNLGASVSSLPADNSTPSSAQADDSASSSASVTDVISGSATASTSANPAAQPSACATAIASQAEAPASIAGDSAAAAVPAFVTPRNVPGTAPSIALPAISQRAIRPIFSSISAADTMPTASGDVVSDVWASLSGEKKRRLFSETPLQGDLALLD